MTAKKSWNSPNPILFQSFKDLKITVTGGNGFLGRHFIKLLLQHGAQKENIYSPASRECDLRKSEDAARAVKGRDIVIHLAARVGGIGLNQRCPADLIYDNSMMGMNVIHEGYKAGVKKIVVAGSVCAYPKFTPVPFKEEDLWNGYPEETNAPYGEAKKMLLVALQSYRQQHGLRGVFLLPANLYGPHDNFDLESSHVIPAMINKFVTARQKELPHVTLWGDGSASREFLYVDDCARGILEATMKFDGPEPINLGTHEETQIKYLAETIKDLTGYKGELLWDTTRPNGQPKRQLDITRAKEAFGFTAQVPLREGLQKTIHWFLENQP